MISENEEAWIEVGKEMYSGAMALVGWILTIVLVLYSAVCMFVVLSYFVPLAAYLTLVVGRLPSCFGL